MKLEKTRRYLEEKISAGTLDTYAVLVGRGGDEEFISHNAGRDTLFDIASMGKVLVTSTLLLRKIGEGQLSLDDPLSRFFPYAPEDKRDIPVRQVLTHSSGIVRVELPDEVSEWDRDRIAEYILSVPLAFKPGTEYRYSCNGYILLGFIAEQLYGMRLDEAYRKYIKEPLGLSRSEFNISPDTPDAAVCHYRHEAGKCFVADSNVYRMGGVAGNGASFWTAADIAKYVRAVLDRNPALYATELFDAAERNLTPDLEEGRGLGYLVTNERYPQTGKLFPVGSFGHCGNTGTSFFIHRESGLYAIVLTNATRFSYLAHDCKFCEYDKVCKMREEIHNCIFEDLN